MRDIKTWDELKKEVKELRNLKENISFEDFSKSILLPAFKETLENFEYEVNNRDNFSIHGGRQGSPLNYKSDMAIGVYGVKNKLVDNIDYFLDELLINYSSEQLEKFVEKNAKELGLKINKEGKVIEFLEKLKKENEDYSYNDLCTYFISDKLKEISDKLYKSIEFFEKNYLKNKDILNGRKDDIIHFTNDIIIKEFEENNLKLLDRYDDLKQDIYNKWRNIKEKHINEGKDETLYFYDEQNQMELKRCLEEIEFYELLENEEDTKIVENLKYYEENHNYIKGIKNTEKFEKYLKDKLKANLKLITEDFNFEIPKVKEETKEEIFNKNIEKFIFNSNKKFKEKISDLETENLVLYYGNGYSKWRKNTIFDISFYDITEEILNHTLKEKLEKINENSNILKLKEETWEDIVNLTEEILENKDFNFIETYLLKNDNTLTHNFGSEERIKEFSTTDKDIETYKKDVISYYYNTFINEKKEYFRDKINQLFDRNDDLDEKETLSNRKEKLLQNLSKENVEHIEEHLRIKEEVYNAWRDNKEEQLLYGVKEIELNCENKEVQNELKDLYIIVFESKVNFEKNLKEYENKYNQKHNITDIDKRKEEYIKNFENKKAKHIIKNEAKIEKEIELD